MEQQAGQLVEQVSFFRSLSGASRPAARPVTAQRASAPVKAVRPRPIVAATKPALAPAPRLAKASGDDSTWQEF
jgi:hypothetical protein